MRRQHLLSRVQTEQIIGVVRENTVDAARAVAEAYADNGIRIRGPIGANAGSLNNIIQGNTSVGNAVRPTIPSAAFGNAATRIAQNAVTGGAYVYGTHPEVDGLFSEQANETNLRVRTQILHKLQQIMHERVMFIPVMEEKRGKKQMR